MAESRLPHLIARSVTALVVIAFNLTVTAAWCQEHSDNEPMRVSHRPPESQLIPPPGTLMPIKVQLPKNAEVNTKVRLIGSRDGRFMDIAFPMGQFEEGSRPTFTIEIPAPTAAMTYNFIVHQPNGDLLLSEKFLIKRQCLVPTPASGQDDPPKEYKEQVSSLIAQARALERDNINLETALKLLDGLKKDLSE